MKMFSIQEIKKWTIIKPVKGVWHRTRNFCTFFLYKLPYYTEIKIKYVLRKSFRIRHMHRLQRVEEVIREIEQKPKKERIRIVFICLRPSVWNSVMSIFLAADKNPLIDAYILAIPEKLVKENRDLNHEDYGENESYEYCRTFCENTIRGYNEEEKEWFDLRKFAPDYVFAPMPYAIHLPSPYTSHVLAGYTKLCYVPYGYCLEERFFRSANPLDFIDDVYAYFADNQRYCDELKRVCAGLVYAGWKKINYFGYPRFDLYKQIKKQECKYKKTILWLPRWITETWEDNASTFFIYKDILIDYFKNHPDIRFVCRPHPFMFPNFISTGEMTEKDVNEFKNIFKRTENFYLDESPDYRQTFVDTDVFISDFTSLLVEELIIAKPIIFLADKKQLDDEGWEWTKYLFHIANKKELLKKLEEVLDGEDPLEGERKQYVKEHMKVDGKIGERIVQFLVEDYINL